MNNTDRIAALIAARHEATQARTAWETATTKRARNEASEALDFWNSKAAFFFNEKGWA